MFSTQPSTVKLEISLINNKNKIGPKTDRISPVTSEFPVQKIRSAKKFPFDDIIMRIILRQWHVFHNVLTCLKQVSLFVAPYSSRYCDNDLPLLEFSGQWELTHWSRDKMAASSQTTFSNAFSWMKMHEFCLRFHWSLFLSYELTTFHHWLR